MALSVGVHTVVGSGAAVTTVTTSGIATQASGSGLVATMIWSVGGTFVSLTDNKGNAAPTQIGTEQVLSASRVRRYYFPTITGGAGHTFTLTVTAAVFASLWIVEVLTTNGQGILLDQSAVGTDAASPYVSPNITTIAEEILYGDVGETAGTSPFTHTAGAGFTLQDELTDFNTNWTGASGTRIVSATGTYATSWTITGTITDTDDGIASFSEVGAVVVPISAKHMMGVMHAPAWM